MRLPACAGACSNPIWIAACVAGRQPLHVGACPRKLAGQANFALHTAHTRRGIVPRGASLSETVSEPSEKVFLRASRHKLLLFLKVGGRAPDTFLRLSSHARSLHSLSITVGP